MLLNVVIGLSTMAVCLLLQSVLIVVALRYYSRHDILGSNPTLWSTLLTLNSVMTLLVLGNLVQLVVWAVVFMLLGEFETLDAAVYHSAVNFASLGYGDIVMSERHRLLGALEAINGVLMIGVSTAALMTTLQDAFSKTRAARSGRV
ncbi:ion channel [Lysobacter niastensis]|uniref:Two pore domain potassium channel family protein n=1 Tax=Lysobacter niastensis TaxID=380629 RepID=A0ABS0BAK9_9GAMM|nr:ion channel [Lysobacter niastensis]MBF6026023.1 two pore domain potassium channel family protein [Lysobacter niastensis]